jgi:putative NADH-flavin reductase
MRLTIFAATGGVGRQLLEQSVAAGHEVTAVVRNPSVLARSVRTVQADLNCPDAARLKEAVTGADAVLSGLGPRRRADAGIVSRGTRAIIEAMEASAVRRLVIVSVAGVALPPGPGSRTILEKVLGGIANGIYRRHYADIALVEGMLRSSELDWTSVGVPLLNDGPAKGSYRVAVGEELRRGLRLSRADAAHCMLDVLPRPEMFRQSIAVGY